MKNVKDALMMIIDIENENIRSGSATYTDQEFELIKKALKDILESEG